MAIAIRAAEGTESHALILLMAIFAIRISLAAEATRRARRHTDRNRFCKTGLGAYSCPGQLPPESALSPAPDRSASKHRLNSSPLITTAPIASRSLCNSTKADFGLMFMSREPIAAATSKIENRWQVVARHAATPVSGGILALAMP